LKLIFLFVKIRLIRVYVVIIPISKLIHMWPTQTSSLMQRCCLI